MCDDGWFPLLYGREVNINNSHRTSCIFSAWMHDRETRCQDPEFATEIPEPQYRLFLFTTRCMAIRTQYAPAMEGFASQINRVCDGRFVQFPALGFGV